MLCFFFLIKEKRKELEISVPIKGSSRVWCLGFVCWGFVSFRNSARFVQRKLGGYSLLVLVSSGLKTSWQWFHICTMDDLTRAWEKFGLTEAE